MMHGAECAGRLNKTMNKAISRSDSHTRRYRLYEKIREVCPYDISCMIRYHFIRYFSSQYTENWTIHPELRKATTKHSLETQSPRLTQPSNQHRADDIFELGVFRYVAVLNFSCFHVGFVWCCWCCCWCSARKPFKSLEFMVAGAAIVWDASTGWTRFIAISLF